MTTYGRPRQALGAKCNARPPFPGATQLVDRALPRAHPFPVPDTKLFPFGGIAMRPARQLQFCTLTLPLATGLVLVLGTSAVAHESGSEATKMTEPKVLAFYYPWYGNPEVSGNWVHWRVHVSDRSQIPEDRLRAGRTSGFFLDPLGDFSELDEKGLPLIQGKNHPAIGLYDSNDPLVIRGHLKLAQQAGIDALIVSWWGQGDFSDKVLSKMLDEAEAIGSAVKLTAYYETVPDDSPDRAVEDLMYLLNQYGARASWLKVDGKPVIFLYGRAMSQLSVEQWADVIARVQAQHPAIIIADTDAAHLPPANADGAHFYNPADRVRQGQDMQAFYSEYVGRVRERGKIACLTVIPGYDDTVIRVPGFSAPRENGLLYRRLWEAAIAAGPDWLLITSWNEWHEGSEIEPSIEDGRLYLDLTQEFSAAFKRRLGG